MKTTKIITSEVLSIVNSGVQDYVHVKVMFKTSEPFDHEVSEIQETFFIRDSDQAVLNRLGDREFEVAATGERIQVR